MNFAIKDDAYLVRQFPQEELEVVCSNEGLSLKKRGLLDRIKSYFGGEEKVQRSLRFKKYVDGALCSPRFERDWKEQAIFYTGIEKWNTHRKKEIRHIANVFLGKLAEKCSKLREKYLQTVKKEPSGQKSARAFWAFKKAESDYSEGAGMNPVAATRGISEATFGVSLNGKEKITVCKAKRKDTRRINEKTFGLRPQWEVCLNDPRQAESVSFMLDQQFGFDLVPPTDTDENGFSVQLFEPRGVEGHKSAIQKRIDLNPEEIEKMQIMALFNYLAGDLDGKDDSWKILFSPEGRIEKVVKYDNGNTFPAVRLNKKKDWYTLRKTFSWKKHEWAKSPLSPQKGGHLDQILTKLQDPRQLNRFICEVKEKYPQFWTEDRICLLKERASLILAASRLHLSLEDLGSVYSTEYFQEVEQDTELEALAKIQLKRFDSTL